MRKKSQQFVIILLLGTLGFSLSPAIAQTGLQTEADYFQEHRQDFEDWLDSTQLSQYIQVKKLKVKPERLLLFMEIANRDAWFDLKDEFKQQFQTNFAKKLMDKFLFQMAIGKDSAEINILCTSEDYPIGIYYKDGKLTVDEALPLVTTKGMFQLKISDFPTGKPQTAKGKVEHIKRNVKLYLRDYYLQKSSFWHKVHFSVIDNDEEMSFEISNLKKEVLNDFVMGYFEFIMIDMYFVQKGSIVEVTYELQAKYGSGIFIAPRRSGYKDMEPKYQDYVERYRKKFRSMIKDVLNAKKLKG